MTRIGGRAALIGAIGLVAAPAPGQAVHLQLPVEAAMQDAAAYARLFDLPLADAMQRMRAQAASVPATDALRAEFADRWAGVAIEHRPAYRIVVLLTGNEPVADRSILAGGIVVPITFRTAAAATRDVMLAKIREFQADIRAALPHPPGIGLDQRTGEMVVMVADADLDLDRDGALSRRFATMAGVPVRIEAVDRPLLGKLVAPVDMARDARTDIGAIDPITPDLLGGDPLGGARVTGTVDGKRYVCTTGFVVTDGTRAAIATAAHCPDALRYVGRDRRSVDLAFDGQWGWGYQDVQINLIPAAPVPAAGPSGASMPAPLFYADTAKTLVRSVATWRNRASTRAGDIVCHRGERTGYSCAPVAMVDFAPAGDLCGGACSPTWVAVEGPTCKAGDSGAPVFDGQVALGLVKGGTYRADGSCLFYYYMSTDYLPPGWTLRYR